MNEPDLIELRNHPRLLKVAEFGDEIYTKESKNTGSKVLVRTPESYNEKKKYPLLFVLHWRGGNNTEFEVYWNKVLEQKEILLCLLQSSQLSGDNQFCWDDESKGLLEFQQAFLSLRNKFNIDFSKRFTQNIVLFGTSFK